MGKTFRVNVYLKSGQTIVLPKMKTFRYKQDSITTSIEWEHEDPDTAPVRILKLPVDNIAAITYENE